MGFSSPKPPQIPMPPPAAHPPTLGSNEALTGSKTQQAGTAAEGLGADNTIKTSPQGLTTTPTLAKATLLGQ